MTATRASVSFIFSFTLAFLGDFDSMERPSCSAILLIALDGWASYSPASSNDIEKRYDDQ